MLVHVAGPVVSPQGIWKTRNHPRVEVRSNRRGLQGSIDCLADGRTLPTNGTYRIRVTTSRCSATTCTGTPTTTGKISRVLPLQVGETRCITGGAGIDVRVPYKVGKEGSHTSPRTAPST
ncbi:uncharacterized protein LOC118418983 [Branchiostoma floridae]|uniref:Uncharacterized protein LOC118418983 n=1 Tax=Branchiostoma floridae TaxID=7739 RepID=A0A9J7MV43_BRAFL|nr:uncharacterized protein LOC118418983 [Branchiostoma floridae]